MEYPEGATRLDPDEIEDLKHPHVTTRGELDHLEQSNIQVGLQWLSRSRQKDLLSESFMRELHRRMFGEVWEWAGSFRLREKNIGVDPITIPVELRKLIADMKFWMDQETYSNHVSAIRFHHRLVKIHLFPNGNGRHSRIMADAILTKLCDHPPIDWAGGQDLQNLSERRKEYILALRRADEDDYRPLIDLLSISSSS